MCGPPERFLCQDCYRDMVQYLVLSNIVRDNEPRTSQAEVRATGVPSMIDSLEVKVLYPT